MCKEQPCGNFTGMCRSSKFPGFTFLLSRNPSSRTSHLSQSSETSWPLQPLSSAWPLRPTTTTRSATSRAEASGEALDAACEVLAVGNRGAASKRAMRSCFSVAPESGMPSSRSIWRSSFTLLPSTCARLSAFSEPASPSLCRRRSCSASSASFSLCRWRCCSASCSRRRCSRSRSRLSSSSRACRMLSPRSAAGSTSTTSNACLSAAASPAGCGAGRRPAEAARRLSSSKVLASKCSRWSSGAKTWM
mmetsp:Transcript_35170/g.95354  ORF Transcript_35170/g.95354 Transcript_35170/m.95354 type:complete len:248 (+) Transcript_35170:187-930(+)